MTTKLTGILTDIFPVETFPNFAKRVFWLKQPDTERYPQHWAIELHGDDMKHINRFRIGDRLECEVEVRGRKWKKPGQQGIIVTLKCLGIRPLEQLHTTTTHVGSYVPKQSKRYNDDDPDRHDPQVDIPF